MKIIVLATAFLALSVLSYSAEKATDMEKLGLKGKVKERICLNYKMNGKDSILDHKMVQKFNENGCLIEELLINSQNITNWKNSFIYNSDNKLVKKEVYLGDNQLSEQHLYYYENTTNIRDNTINIKDNTTNIVYYLFDNNNNMIKSNNIKIDYIYDTKNRITNEYVKKNYIKIYQYNNNNKISGISLTLIGDSEDLYINQIYTYDDQSRISSITNINKNNQKDSYIEIYSYNSRGNLNEIKKINPSSKTAFYTSQYKYIFGDTINLTNNDVITSYENVNYIIEKVQASSTIKPFGKYNFYPSNLIDGDNSTSWQESKEGKKEGQWVKFIFKNPIDLYGFDIVNGFQLVDEKYGDLYYKNSRLKVAKITVNDSKTGKTIELDDTKNTSRFILKGARCNNN